MFETWASWLFAFLIVATLISAAVSGYARNRIAAFAVTAAWVFSQFSTEIIDDTPVSAFMIVTAGLLVIYYTLSIRTRGERERGMPHLIWPVICFLLELAMLPAHFFSISLGWMYLWVVNSLFAGQLFTIITASVLKIIKR